MCSNRYQHLVRAFLYALGCGIGVSCSETHIGDLDVSIRDRTKNEASRITREWEEIYENRQVNFTDNLYIEYNAIKQTFDYVDDEVVLSSDGSTLAVKGKDNFGKSFYAIYESDINRDQWLYNDDPIEPTNGKTIPGRSISLSKDGRGTAVGGLECNPILEEKSGVICYDFNSQRGPNFSRNDVGTDWGDSFGTTVALNDDSSVLAVGSSRGRVYVYVATPVILAGTLDENRIGNFIDLGGPGTFGEVVKVTGNPTNPTVVVGGTGGKISAFRYGKDTGWRKLANDIDATDGGTAFEVSNDGNIIAFVYRNAIVKVYEYVQSNGSSSWIQRGQNLFAENGKKASVSLSSNGNIVALGSYNGPDNSGARPGIVTMYEYVNGAWAKYSLVVEDTRLENEADFGRSVSLSGDGTILAVAAPAFTTTNDKQKGYAAVFQVGNPFPSAAPSSSPVSPPTRAPTGQPTKSNQPSNSPVIRPTSDPTSPPSYTPTQSMRPSYSPSKSFPPTPFPSPLPTPSVCEHDCDCKEGSECDLSECKYNCNCDGGFCDMRKCQYDCRCDGGYCNMNRCGSNCQCENRGCQMDNCIYNTRCVARNTSGTSTRTTRIALGTLVLMPILFAMGL